MLKSFFEQGFYKWSATEVADIIPKENLEFDLETTYLINEPNEIRIMLAAAQYMILEKFIEPYAIECEVLNACMRCNAKQSSRFCEWHSDSLEYSNAIFNLYLTDLSNYDEGAVLFKKGEDIWRNVPKYGDLIAINNQVNDVLHRVEYTEKDRLVATFSYRIKWSDDYSNRNC